MTISFNQLNARRQTQARALWEHLLAIGETEAVVMARPYRQSYQLRVAYNGHDVEMMRRDGYQHIATPQEEPTP